MVIDRSIKRFILILVLVLKNFICFCQIDNWESITRLDIFSGLRSSFKHETILIYSDSSRAIGDLIYQYKPDNILLKSNFLIHDSLKSYGASFEIIDSKYRNVYKTKRTKIDILYIILISEEDKKNIISKIYELNIREIFQNSHDLCIWGEGGKSYDLELINSSSTMFLSVRNPYEYTDERKLTKFLEICQMIEKLKTYATHIIMIKPSSP